MPPTTTAPIREPRLNQYVFVGETAVRTIQAAVSYAVSEGGGFLVIIPPGYVGNDSIAAVTGGAANVYLSDQRTTSTQNYLWSGTAYVPADLIQRGSMSLDNGELWLGDTTVPPPNVTSDGGNLRLNAAPLNGIFLNQTTGGYTSFGDGDGHEVARINANGDATFQRNLSAAGDLTLTGDIALLDAALSLGVVGVPAPNVTSDGGNLHLNAKALDGVFINHESGGYTSFGDGAGHEVARINTQGEGNFDGGVTTPGTMIAADAEFETCEVNGSPVRTFANTPDGGGPGGMVYPNAGVPVSTGAAWAASIDPALLARWTSTQDMTLAAGKLSLGNAGLPAPNVTSDGGNLLLNAAAADGVFLNRNSGGYISFGNGAGGEVARINTQGEGNFNGGVTTPGSVTASDAEFATCEVGGSPVRTFANTPASGGGVLVGKRVGFWGHSLTKPGFEYTGVTGTSFQYWQQYFCSLTGSTWTFNDGAAGRSFSPWIFFSNYPGISLENMGALSAGADGGVNGGNCTSGTTLAQDLAPIDQLFIWMGDNCNLANPGQPTDTLTTDIGATVSGGGAPGFGPFGLVVNSPVAVDSIVRTIQLNIDAIGTPPVNIMFCVFNHLGGQTYQVAHSITVPTSSTGIVTFSEGYNWPTGDLVVSAGQFLGYWLDANVGVNFGPGGTDGTLFFPGAEDGLPHDFNMGGDPTVKFTLVPAGATFYANLDNALNILLTAKPTLRIVFIDHMRTNRFTVASGYFEVIRTVLMTKGQQYGIPVVDMLSCSSLGPYTWVTWMNFDDGNYLHPTNDGWAQFTPIVARQAQVVQ